MKNNLANLYRELCDLMEQTQKAYDIMIEQEDKTEQSYSYLIEREAYYELSNYDDNAGRKLDAAYDEYDREDEKRRELTHKYETLKQAEDFLRNSIQCLERLEN